MSQTELPTMEQRLARWALSGDTGASSQTLACAVLGIRQEDRAFPFDVPYDYSDFGRCYRLVQLVPEILTMWDHVGQGGGRLPGLGAAGRALGRAGGAV